MLYQIREKIQLISGVILASTTLTIPVNAQPITPAADGTGTIVNQQDNIINITGGQTSSNGANLFHSFDQFGVNTGQTANFQSSPEINNILGRVVGGNASIINGILQVTGGNSNLFLMNPAGILFGPNASLNVPADFTATTATSIGFGNNNWFQSIGDNNWANLVGNPIDFSFNLAQPGWVVNFGDLTLNSGQNLTLLGGGILNSGNLSAPGGNISIAAVPGESLVRISQPGNILSLDIATPGLNEGVINPLSLPQLLTGGSQILDATQVQHNADGTITLTSSGVTIDPNSDNGAETKPPFLRGVGGILSVSGDVTTETSGQVNVLTGGGNIILDQVNSDKVNINANGGNIAQVNSDSLINASAVQLQTEGEGGIGLETEPLRLEANNLEATAGSGGAFFNVPNGDITVGGVTDELTGMSITDGGDFSLESVGSITLLEDIYTATDYGNAGSITLTSNQGSIDGSGAFLNARSWEGNAGFVTLNALGDIQLSGISSYSEGSGRGGDISVTSENGGISAISVNSDSHTGDGGFVTLNALGDIEANNISSFGDNSGGNIQLSSGNNIYILWVGSGSLNGTGGDIILTAGNAIATGDILSYGFEQGGNINLTTNFGDIDTGNLDAQATSENGVDGNITIAAHTGSITIGELNGLQNITIADGGTDNIWDDNPLVSATADADTVNSKSGQVSIQAHNDITVNEAIVTDSIESLALAAGRNININADIDTSGSNGDITLQANHNGADLNYRQPGTGNITMAPGTSLKAGGNILLQLGTLAEVGNITLANLNTRGTVTVMSPGGNIFSADTNSLITANAGTFQTYGSGGIGTAIDPIDITLNNLEASAGSGGAYFHSPNGAVTVGGASNNLSGISTSRGGAVSLTAAGNITVSEDISTLVSSGNAGNITLTSQNGAIDGTGNLRSYANQANAGSVALNAAGNIAIGDIDSFGSGGDGGFVTLDAGGNIAIGDIDSYGDDGDGGAVTLDAGGNITTGDIYTTGYIVGDGGAVTLEAVGNITTGYINSKGSSGDGGGVTMTAEGNIATGGIDSTGSDADQGAVKLEAGGNITTGIIDSSGYGSYRNAVTMTAEGNIATGGIYLFGDGGDGGDLTITAEGNIATGDIDLFGYAGDGGDVTMTAEGNITTGDIDSRSNIGEGGAVSLTAAEDIRIVGGIESVGSTKGGDIALTSNYGAIDTSAGILNSQSAGGSAGHITLDANSDIRTGFVVSSAGSPPSEGGVGGGSASSQGGDITIISRNGAINTRAGNLVGEAQINPTDDVSALETASIFENNSANLSAYSQDGTGGNVSLSAAGDITTSHISAFGPQGTGNVDLTSNNGAINTGSILSFSENGNAGNVTLKAANDINTSHLSAWGNQQGGNITINGGGNFDIGEATIHSFSQESNAGDVKITTSGNTTLGGDDKRLGIRSAGQTEGGNITIRSYGNIDTTAGDLETYSETGTGGDVYLHADSSVNTRNIRTFGPVQSGDIKIISGNSSVNTASLETIAPNGTSGNIDINTYGTEGNIQTAKLVSAGEDGSGTITVVAEDGSVITENITSQATEGDSGDITVDGEDDVITGDITSQGGENSGNISVSSQEGSTTTGDVTTTAENGNSRDVTVAAQDNVQTGNITSQAGQNSGNISVNSNAGSATTGNVATVAQNGSSGNIAVRANNDIYTLNISSLGNENSGDISVTSETGNINTANLETVAETGNSGDVDLTANQDINTGDISSIAGTNSGDIAATSTEGAISTGDIETSAETGIAGDVTLNAQNDINTGSITSTGAISSGDITVNSAEGVVNNGEIYTDTGEINIHQGGLNSENTNSGLTNSISQDTLSFNPVFNPENHQNINDSDSQINLPQNLDNLQVFTSNILETSIEDRISTIEESRTSEFAESFGISAENQVITTASAREILGSMAQQTGTQPAVVYVTAYDDQLELIMFTADGSPIRAAVPEANRQALTKQVQEFRNEITHPLKRRSNSYLASAQQLYQWLIAPIEPQLQAAEIDTILFSMDAGLRSLPIAALHDGQQFLVEKYSVSLIPSVSLMDARYQSLQGKKVLAMGADTFPDMNPLPGVAVELNVITQNIWRGTQLFNQEFTRENLQERRKKGAYDIVHLATHADFNPGQNNQTYIYFWNDKLSLDELRDLGLNKPAAELLVLSACRTAVGDEMAELGFAGLAVRTGVKSALASLWYVDDMATLGLMTEFYESLHSAPIKAEALRQAQVAMIHNQMLFSSSQLPGSKQLNETTLPPELVRLQNMNLSHPYFWSGFTMIGSPW